jgi:hypothetical protein
MLGKGDRFENLPQETWKKHVVMESQHIPAVLDFMTDEHHLVRNLVVKKIARTGSPVSPAEISEILTLPQTKVLDLLDELEKNLFFLVRDSAGNVSWAFPVTAEKTPHKLTSDTGEKINAA